MEKTTRCGFLSTTALSTLGIIATASTINAISPEAVGATPVATDKLISGTQAVLDDFIYDIANDSNSWSGAGGNAKEATAEEFPVSHSIAGVSVKLNHGGFPRLHWHSIAAASAFV